jgi:hypothetical protein
MLPVLVSVMPQSGFLAKIRFHDADNAIRRRRIARIALEDLGIRIHN